MALSVEQETLYHDTINALETLGVTGEALSEKAFLKLANVYQLPSRYYHDLNHVNELISAGLDPEWREHLAHIYLDTHDQAIAESQAMLSLVALYHDLIEVHIDGAMDDTFKDAYERGEPVPVRHAIPEAVDIGFAEVRARKGDNGKISMFATVQKPKNMDEANYAMVRNIFGLKDGEELNAAPIGRLNEFYSALLLAHDLGKDIPAAQLASIIGAIELSYPFRDNPFSPGDPVAALKERLGQTAQSSGFEMNDQTIDQAMLLAVGFANRDVASFRQPEFGAFINETMRLAPELTASVRQSCTARNYPQCLNGFIGLFTFVLGEGNHRNALYRQYHSGDITYPPNDVKQQWDKIVDQNLAAGTLYLKTKYVSSTLIAAIAAQIGEPDVALADFVDGTKALLDDAYFQTHEVAKHGIVSRTLRGSGRSDIRGFDIAESPTAAVIFDALKQDEETIDTLYQAACSIDYEQPEEFITQLRKQIGDQTFGRIIGHLEVSADALAKRTTLEITHNDQPDDHMLEKETGYHNRSLKLNELVNDKKTWRERTSLPPSATAINAK